MKIEIELPEEFEKYFEYLKLNFDIDKQSYCENILKKEINSRNFELIIF